MHPTSPCPRMRNHARSRYSRKRANSCRVWKPNRSAAQAQTFDQRFVALRVRRLDIVEQLSTRLDHLDEAAARMVVLAMRLEVFGQVVDALRKDSDLDFGRSCVAVLGRILRNNFLFSFCSYHLGHR